MSSDSTRANNVLVTGAAGGLGARLVARLVDRGWKVRGLVLAGDPLARRLEWLGCEIREGDVSDAASLRGAFDGIDTVYHLAAVIVSNDPTVFGRVNRDGTANVVEASRAAGVRHLVYVSSASVTYPRRTPYAESKLEAEAIVSGVSSIEHTIVRPTLVYDERGGQELAMFRDYLLRFPVVPFIGDGRAKKRPVWSEDLVDGLARIAGNAAAYGKTYNLSGGESISMLDFARLILHHRSIDKPFLHVPVPICRAVAHAMRHTMKSPPLTTSAIAGIVQDADLDPSEATKDLDYRPIGVREGFARCFPVESKLGALDSARTRSPR
jgi:nucleoside-diphosphate-sugar epimerase